MLMSMPATSEVEIQRSQPCSGIEVMLGKTEPTTKTIERLAWLGHLIMVGLDAVWGNSVGGNGGSRSQGDYRWRRK